MIKFKVERKRSSINIESFKKNNTFFLLVYYVGSKEEKYSIILRWNEISKPNLKNIKVHTLSIVKNEKTFIKQSKKRSQKIINSLHIYNKKRW